jgi:hypothetical protein
MKWTGLNWFRYESKLPTFVETEMSLRTQKKSREFFVQMCNCQLPKEDPDHLIAYLEMNTT